MTTSDSRLEPLRQACLLIGLNNSVCQHRVDYSEPEEWPEGRCPYHCRSTLEDGSLCVLPPLSNGHCYKHGGAIQTGLKRYWENSSVAQLRAGNLDGGDRAVYEMALADQDILSMRSDLALIEVRLHQLLEEADSWKSEDLLKEIRTEIKRISREMRAAVMKIKRGTVSISSAKTAKTKIDRLVNECDNLLDLVALTELSVLVDQGTSSYSTWREIDDLLKRRKATSDSEQKRLIESRKMVSADQAKAIIATVMEKMTETVQANCDQQTSRRILSAFANDVRKVIGEQ